MSASRRAIITCLLVGVMALSAVQPAFAAAPAPGTASGSRTTTPASAARPAAATSTSSDSTESDADWQHSEHYMPNASSSRAAASASAPVNAANRRLPYFGGPVITKPAVYLIFWGPQWTNGAKDTHQLVQRDAATYVEDFFQGVGGSPWLNTLTQYCQDSNPLHWPSEDCSKVSSSDRISNPRNVVKTPILKTPCPANQQCLAVFDSSVPPPGFGDLEIRNEVRKVWHQQNRDSSAIYFLFTPSGNTSSDLGANCGYHSWLTKSPPASGGHGGPPPNPRSGESIWYSYVPYQGDAIGCYVNWVNSAVPGIPAPYHDGTLDGFSIVGGHELAEAITDPDIQFIFDPNNPAAYNFAWTTFDVLPLPPVGFEAGDLCQVPATPWPWDTPYGNVWLPATSDQKYHRFPVQGIWSNVDHGCPLGYPLRAVLPAVDNGALGHTTIDVQNRGSGSGSFSIQYFDASAIGHGEDPIGFGDGNAALAANATWSVTQAADNHAMRDGSSGTALVYGLEPVQVAVRQSAGSGHDPSAYAAVVPGAGTGTVLTAADIDFDGNPTGQPGDPAAQTATRVNIVNAGATRTNLSVEFRQPDGLVMGTIGPITLHAGFGTTVTPNAAGIQGVFKGIATIRSAAGDASHPDIEMLPLAAAVTIDRKPADALSTYLATPAAGPFGDGTPLYAPLLYGQPPPPPSAGPTPLSRRTVAAGADFGLALKRDSTVVAWGGNANGQLGNGADLSAGQPVASGTPVPVTSAGGGPLSGVVSVVAGEQFGLALKADGTVWGWGANRSGELGNGGVAAGSKATQVVGPGGTGFLTNVVSLAAGLLHAVAVRSDGTVWTWGDNSYGQLGDNGNCSCRQSSKPIQVVSPDGGFFKDAVAAAPGYGATHSMVIRKDGTLWAWGDNFAYQSGRTTSSTIALPTEIFGPAGVGFLEGIAEASAGFGFNVVLRGDGTAWGWGDDIYNQLGTNLDSFDSSNPRYPVLLAGDVVTVAAGLGDTMLVKSDGTVMTEGANASMEAGFATGNQDVQVLTAVPGVAGATQVAAGDSFEFAVTSAGNVWAWGNNQHGALGRGTVPTCDICTDPQGPGLVLSETLGGSLTGIDPGLDVAVSAKAIARLAVGQSHSLAVTAVGTVVAWGTDNRGQLGNNNNQPVTTPITVPGLSRVVAVAAGLTHSLALTEQGTVYTWGYNGDGELGLGDTTDRYSPVLVNGLPRIVSIAAGASHSLALDATGQVWAWGYGGDGELGDGTTVTRLSPEAVPNLFAVQIAGGLNFSMAIDQVARVFTWGANDFGQLGVGTTTPSLVPVQVAALLGIAQLAAGLREGYALDFQGHLYSWGLGQSGELGNGQSGLSADSHTPVRVVGTDGVTPLAGAQVVASGFGSRAFALMANGTVLGWGSSPLGALGTGTTGSGTPAPVLTAAAGSPFGPIRALAVGYQHTVAVEPDGSAWSWGDNALGQLGLGPSPGQADFPTPIPALPGVAGTGTGGGGGAVPPFSSRLVLAVPGNSSATVTITYLSSIGVATTRQAAIPPNGQIVIDQASPAGPPPSSQPYTAVLTSDQNLAAVAEILPTDPASARATAYNLFRAGGASIGAPLVEHTAAGGQSTALLLMGLSGASVPATVTYLDSNGVAISSVNLTVPPDGIVTADQSVDVAIGTVWSATVTVAGGGRVAVLEVGSGETALTSVSLP